MFPRVTYCDFLVVQSAMQNLSIFYALFFNLQIYDSEIRGNQKFYLKNEKLSIFSYYIL